MNKHLLAWTVALAMLLGLTQPVSAEEGPRTYAVVSLVGDKMNVVTYRISTGSHIDRNEHQAIDISDGMFDNAVLLATESALAAGGISKARVQLFALTTPSLFERQDRFFSDGKLVFPENLLAALKREGATHLLLFTKHRDEARMQVRGGKTGIGKVEGLGFYIDPLAPMISSETQRESKGFLAPYFFVRISLVNLSTTTVLRDTVLTASHTLVTANRPEAYNAWDALKPEEKIEYLRHLIEHEVSKAVPALITSS